MSVSSKWEFRAVRTALLLGACAPLAIAVPAAAADTAASAPASAVHFGKWGVDLNSRDLKANPGDDFERYASGSWMDANEIPADKSQNGVGSEVSDGVGAGEVCTVLGVGNWRGRAEKKKTREFD